MEFSANYVGGPVSGLRQLRDLPRRKGKDIVSSQFNFDPGDLAYIQNHFIYLDHDQTYTARRASSYRFGEGTRVVGRPDLRLGPAQRDGDVPNGGHVPGYTQVNLSASHEFTAWPAGR